MSVSETVVVYGPARASLMAQVKELVAKRELLLSFVERDLKIKYKQTVLGGFWAILPPLMLMVVFSVFFGRFGRLSSEGYPYAVFVYVGLLPWHFFANAVGAATRTLSYHQHIISKVAFPREILPFSHILSAGVDFLVASLILAALILYYHIPLSWTVLFVIPLLLIEIIFIAGVSLIFSISNAYYRDVRYLVPFILQVLMFSSPVLYSARSVPEWLRPFYLVLNPMAALIDSYRQVILRQALPDLRLLTVLAIVVSCTFIVCYQIFKIAERNVADVV